MADKNKPSGRAGVVVSISEGERDLARKKLRRDDPFPHIGRGPKRDILPNKKNEPPNWKPNELGLPGDPGCECPVECLGHQGGTYYFISSSREFRAIGKLDHETLQKLFALTPNYPQWAWPRYGRPPKVGPEQKPKPPPIESFDDDDVRSALLLACERQGLFDPESKMRGRGAWSVRGGGLVYHAGEEVWLYEGDPEDGRFVSLPTGVLRVDPERHLYPRLAELPAPWTEPFGRDDNPAGPLLETYRKWNWTRPDVDPLLMLGHNGVSYLTGALDWRSSILLLGDKGTGKSTLQNALKELYGDALLHSANTTAAGIYQELAHDSRPVAVDELEPGANQRRVDDLIALMRQSASGAFARRGSSDHQAVSFQMHSAFLFSAINNPLHDAADLSRVAVLRLKPLERDQTRPPPIDADRTGPMVLARLMRQWGQGGALFRETRERFKAALSAGGHDARGQDTYGTLLACAELLLGDELAERLGAHTSRHPEWWARHLSVDNLPEVESAMENWRRCVSHLLSTQVEPWRNGVRSTIGKCLADLEEGERAGGLVALEEQHKLGDKGPYNRNHARRDLEMTGLGLLAPGECKIVPPDAGWILAVPNGPAPMVSKLFRDTPYQYGGWMDALRQCPHEGVVIFNKDHNKVTINGMRVRCTLIVLSRFNDAPER